MFDVVDLLSAGRGDWPPHLCRQNIICDYIYSYVDVRNLEINSQNQFYLSISCFKINIKWTITSSSTIDVALPDDATAPASPDGGAIVVLVVVVVPLPDGGPRPNINEVAFSADTFAMSPVMADHWRMGKHDWYFFSMVSLIVTQIYSNQSNRERRTCAQHTKKKCVYVCCEMSEIWHCDQTERHQHYRNVWGVLQSTYILTNDLPVRNSSQRHILFICTKKKRKKRKRLFLCGYCFRRKYMQLIGHKTK